MSKIYIIPNFQCISDAVRLADTYQAHFEYNDFYMPDIFLDSQKIKERIKFYRSLGRDCSKDTMHGAFLDVTIGSMDPDIRRISEDRIRKSMDIAAELGLKAVIVHTNYIAGFLNRGYIDSWIEENRSFFSKLLYEYPNISIYMENMWDAQPYVLKRLYDRINHSRFKVCFDIAHANLHSTPLDIWFDELHDAVRHIHINDNNGIEDLHEIIGTMNVDWSMYKEGIIKYDINPSILIEMSDLKKAEKSIEYLRSNRFYPFC